MEEKGLLLKRKDYLGVDEEAGSHPNRTYYFKKYSDLDNILITCSKSLERDPYNTKALLLRGNTFFKLQQYQEALNDFTLLIKLDSSTIEYYYSRGMTYSKLGLHEMALNDLTYVIKKNPDHVNALFARAACYNTIGQFSAAIEDYNIALLKDQSQNILRSNSSPEKVRRSSLGGSTLSPRGESDGQTFWQQSNDLHNNTNSTNTQHHQEQQNQQNQQRVRSSPQLQSKQSIINKLNHPPLPPPVSPSNLNNNGNSNSNTNININSHSNINNNINHNNTHKNVNKSNNNNNNNNNINNYLNQQYQQSPSPSPTLNQQSPKRSSSQSSNLTADEYHRRGFEFRKQGDFNRAIVEYTHALELDSNHFKAYFNRAFAYDKLHDYSNAVLDYTKAIEIDKMNSYAYYNRGITYDKQGKYQAACQDFQIALKFQPTNIDFMYNLALSYKKLNNLQVAVDYFHSCLQLDSNHVKSHQSLGNCYERLENYQEALQHYDLVLQITPQNISCLISKAHLLHTMGGLENYQLSIRLYSSILDQLYPDGQQDSYYTHLHPQSNHNNINNNNNNSNEKRKEEAISIIFSRAHVYEDMNDFKSAIRDISLAIELASQDRLTSITQQLRNQIIPEILRDGLNYISLSLLYSTRGIYYKTIEKYEQSIEDFTTFFNFINQETKEINNENSSYVTLCVSVYNHRGYCYRKLNNYLEAIQDYTQAILLLPTGIRSFNNRAYCYAKIGKYNEAIQDYTSVIHIDETNAHAYHNRGISYDKLGLFDKAIEDFSKVIELDASNNIHSNVNDNLNSTKNENLFKNNHSLSNPPSGRSTPGIFTPIRSGGQEHNHQNYQQPPLSSSTSPKLFREENMIQSNLNNNNNNKSQLHSVESRSRTPTNFSISSSKQSIERKAGNDQLKRNFVGRSSNKSPNPTSSSITDTFNVQNNNNNNNNNLYGIDFNQSNRKNSSLQESIRAKMLSPSPHTSRETNSSISNNSKLNQVSLDSKINDSIQGIHEAAKKLSTVPKQQQQFHNYNQNQSSYLDSTSNVRIPISSLSSSSNGIIKNSNRLQSER